MKKLAPGFRRLLSQHPAGATVLAFIFGTSPRFAQLAVLFRAKILKNKSFRCDGDKHSPDAE